MDTKERILQVALDLFSQKGYSAVSIRDICKLVEIKESTVYYHFQNKQDIFDTLTERFSSVSERLISSLSSAMQNPEKKLDDSFFENVGNIYIEKFLMDSFCNSFIRALYIEQFGNDKARELYEKWMFDYPLSTQERIFSYCIKLGIIPQTDVHYLAVRYYAPIYFYFQRYLLSGKLTDEKKELFRKKAYQHIIEFMKG